MPARRRLVLLACACALALVPASAHAAVTQVIGLGAASNGIAVGADGNVYVVEPVAQQVTVLTPDGRVVRRVALPAGGATSAALGPDGQVWVAMTAAKGFVRIAADGTTASVSTAGLFQCGPVGMAPFDGRMFFTPPSDGACGTHGIGSIGPNGEAPASAGAGTNVGFDLAVTGGKLYVPMFGDDVIARRAITAGAPGAVEASFPAPAGAGPNGIAVGADGDLWVTYVSPGQVARLSPSAPSGTAPTPLASGLGDPFGLVGHPDGGMYAASNSDARLVRIAPDGTTRPLALPAGFHPWQLATVNRDTWVTDNVTAQVGRVVDDVPIARLVADAAGVTAEVDPRGNDTTVALTIAPAAGGAAIVRAATPATIAAGIGEQPRGFFLNDLAAGTYAVTATATNARGTVTTAPVEFTVAAAALPPATPAPAKPKKPTFAQVVSLAGATKCLSRRQLTLTLRKRKTGSKVTAVAVTIGKAKKAKTYKGSKLKVPITLTGLPKGTFRVKVVVTLADRTKLTLIRTYKTCAPKQRR
jgi:streptogramin lyase